MKCKSIINRTRGIRFQRFSYPKQIENDKMILDNNKERYQYHQTENSSRPNLSYQMHDVNNAIDNQNLQCHCLIQQNLNTRKLICHQHSHTDNREDYSSSCPQLKQHNPKSQTDNHKK